MSLWRKTHKFAFKALSGIIVQLRLGRSLHIMKGNKSFSKRLRVTKKGKIIARVPGHNHFNAKESGTGRQRRRRATGFHATMNATARSRFLPGSNN